MDLKMGMGHASEAMAIGLPTKALTQSIDYVKAILPDIPNSVLPGDYR